MKWMRFLLLLCPGLLGACATGIRSPDGDKPAAPIALQRIALDPRNGGQLVDAAALRPGDILLSSAPSLTSAGVQLLTLAPVSHALLHIGGGRVVEAVGQGVRERGIAEVLEEESVVVAFRHPRMNAEYAERIAEFSRKQVGKRYDHFGIILQAPFTLERRLCELPLVPSLVRDLCIRGIGAIQMGVASKDSFFCSQLVLEAYRQAQLPLTDANPRLLSPRDILHMREGDVPSVRTHDSLTYVGHLKFRPPAVENALTLNN